ncbi:tRNA preQ1(34) S-adenosylmethionine ribosyltransferase-isomerase QueA [Haploplasma axanthum]|uniref:S-adenosylmethionine:tRNA ribosyltransferase-isomerase n=1 Tax=Haploplasma axanthum TaxID=29552 RepID=A0A449BEA5_HAPAX|nr:tRNA preQ1(34) S-adenosylmethionine ribosyltransferase-isomerase QueA [Haploplasma axanthum]VEU80758.1 S-adenosylmethionine:tRNA ribosyltransferase-isomerase [Haploplasma axanthum]
MKVEDFNFELPVELIAQSPMEKRDYSKLLVMDKKTGDIEHKHFYDIVDYLNEGDVLVLNETKVLPARLFGSKKDTNAHIEILLLKEISKDKWETLVKPAKRIKVGDEVTFGDKLIAKCIGYEGEGIRIFELIYNDILIEILEELGTMPLPPYITERLNDKDRYQTVYAKELGSAAAPTAGLHFTKEILEKIKVKGIKIIPVTLHVGLGTFRPVSVDAIEDHKMHSETYHITSDSAKALNEAVDNKKKIIAVGTTSIRTLESNYNNGFHAGVFDTSIFIYPGYKFKVVDELITNFHLPKSSLIMLVSALSSKENIMNAYHEAIKNKYRFFSFGDAMYIKMK